VRESPIFIKSFETLEWILSHTRKFPKHQRFVMAKRIEEAALSFHDQLLWATKTPDKRAALREADFHLERLKLYNRLAMRLQLSSFTQYEFLAGQLTELGRLLGGWQCSLKGSAPSLASELAATRGAQGRLRGLPTPPSARWTSLCRAGLGEAAQAAPSTGSGHAWVPFVAAA
jgi:hypothetical protein